jgi:nitrite reductase (cytochrome c-552)
MLRKAILGLALLGLVFVGAGIGILLTNITQHQVEALQYPLKVVEIADDEIDPAVWGENFPLHYDRFMMTEIDGNRTPYGGSEVYSKLENNPNMVRLWAGYAFSKDHNEERGHFYAQTDQANTQRVKLVDQPGACINCHAAEAPGLIAEMGWEEFNHTPYNDLVSQIHTGSSCSDCHDPNTMALRITRPALINALEKQGIDWTEATRQEMRTYVCAQCHVEYYFAGDNKVLTFPWANGMNIDEIDRYYQETGFTDWTHGETGGRMLKMQHPETELYSTGLHASSGVSCADCHMPYIRQGGVKISDHWLRSPLENINAACQTCHNLPEEQLETRILTIQNRTAELLKTTEEALLASADAIVAAKESGVTEEALVDVYTLQRRAQMRWDFISSENSTGFHSPQEAARVLAHAIDLAYQARIGAMELLAAQTSQQVSLQTE